MKLVFIAATAALAGFASSQQPYQSVAPELNGAKWINTADGKPITLASRKGKVTVVHFWKFACSNCQANLPAYDRLYSRFAKDGVEFIGVHTPELDMEKVEANVLDAIKKRNIKYPVMIDPEGKNWLAWRQRYWPTVYVIDKTGRVRYYWEGELAWKGANGEAMVSEAISQALRR